MITVGKSDLYGNVITQNSAITFYLVNNRVFELHSTSKPINFLTDKTSTYRNIHKQRANGGGLSAHLDHTTNYILEYT